MRTPGAFTGVGETKHEYITFEITKALNHSKEHHLALEGMAADAKRGAYNTEAISLQVLLLECISP